MMKQSATQKKICTAQLQPQKKTISEPQNIDPNQCVMLKEISKENRSLAHREILFSKHAIQIALFAPGVKRYLLNHFRPTKLYGMHLRKMWK